SLISALLKNLKDVVDIEIAVCPPFTSLSFARKLLDGSNIKLGGQDLFWKEEGAFTGEISSKMLKDVGCEYVIIGHSERRQHFGETNETVRKKIKKALENGLKPIFCIGETLKEREDGKTEKVLDIQIREALNDLNKNQLNELVIAYEPVWAIGTGKVATETQAQEAHRFIRNLLGELFGETIKNSVRIQYGGSVKPENITAIIQQQDVDGALVGGASLNADYFTRIVLNSRIEKRG
ncbi:MAG: triose-phosphate isomerase, partial [Candidatus Omnitrophica bacterium]|nr:triose-phosphate isomerase [Candidatus Omnitrophota bacterium]